MGTQCSFGIALERNEYHADSEKSGRRWRRPGKDDVRYFQFNVEDGIIFATSFRFSIVLFFDAEALLLVLRRARIWRQNFLKLLEDFCCPLAVGLLNW
jgi:hypothetical protein